MDREARLSPRQAEIMRLAARGLTDKEISQELGISVGTLRSHWDRMRARFDAANRGAVIARAYLAMHQTILDEIDVLNRALASQHTLVWTVRHDGFVDYCNEGFQRFSGLPADTFIGPGCRELMPKAQRAAMDERWRRARGQGEGFEAEVLLHDAAGTCVPHLVRLTPLQRVGDLVVTWLGTGERLAPRPPEKAPKAPAKPRPPRGGDPPAVR